MCSRGVLVHCPSRLGAAVAVQAAEIPCGEGFLTKSAREHAKAVHHCDGVMSHSYNCRSSSLYDPELKTTARHERNGGRLAPMIGSK
jgi:hypothetical protein